jgi:flagellar basal body-associated protein FliL
MTRNVLVGVVAVALVALAYFLFGTAPTRPVGPERLPDAPEVPSASPTVARRPAPPVTDAPEDPPTLATSEGRLDASVDPPTGPFEVDLGAHTLYLKTDPENRVIRARFRVVVGTAAAQRETRLRREELLRMVYFLGTHRAAEGAEGEAGRDRFARDLLDRFRNVIRSGPVEAVLLDDWSLGPRPDPSGRKPGAQ